MHILIATVTAGGGHLAAAAALEESWHALCPHDVVEKIDLLKFSSRLQRGFISKGYIKLVERVPELWSVIFKKTDNRKAARRLNRLQRLVPSQTRLRFKRHVKHFKPDAVLCTHYGPLDMLARLHNRPFVVSVVTDFEAHAMWMDASVDLYCVAAEETKARLVARGALADNVAVTGIPISAKFKSKINPAVVRKACGLRDDKPVILVLSGGFGMGPVKEVLAALDKIQKPLQTLVVCGRNDELQRKLAGQEYKHPAHILGFSTNMHELMAAANLIVTKPGGLTSSEALAMGKPIFVLNPIPGQEAANSDFLLERGAAAKVNRIEDLPYRIEQMLGSKKLTDMAKAARALGRPHAARAVCNEVLKRLSPN